MIRIVAPHFVAGVVVERGRVVRAAPILRYMIGWHEEKVRDYVVLKGWKTQAASDEDDRAS